MTKSLKIYFVVFVALIVVIVLIDSTRKKTVDWSKSYKLEDKNPLGLYIFDQEIDNLTRKQVIRYNLTPYEYFQEKKGVNQNNETFLIINDYAFLDSLSIHAIMNSVSKGSTFFISSDGYQKSLLDRLNVKNNYQYLEANLLKKESAILTMTNKKWQAGSFTISPIVGEYVFTMVDSKTTTALGYITYPDEKKYICFIRVKFGKGYVYLHNQPVVFTNFSLLSENDISDYVTHVLSYIPKDKPIVWLAKDQTYSNGTKGEKSAKTTLGVIFRYPSLRFAWLIFLYGLIVFIFFHAKRKQRVVPVIKPLQNTTVEFTQTIGNLYYQEGEVSDIIGKKIIYLLDKIRNKYYLDTQNLDDSFIRKLQIKSGKDGDLIKQIVNSIQKYDKTKKAEEKDLILLNELIEKFWEHGS
jgi:hypothetical protein